MKLWRAKTRFQYGNINLQELILLSSNTFGHHQNSLLFFRISLASDFLCPHFCLTFSCLTSCSLRNTLLWGRFKAATCATKFSEQLNRFASTARVYFLESWWRSFLISSMTSSDTRGVSGFAAEGRRRGGSWVSIFGSSGKGRRNRGDAGAVVRENGEGAVGGGRWMNVKSDSSFVTVAIGLSMSGSTGRYGGRGTLRFLYVRLRVALVRTNMYLGGGLSMFPNGGCNMFANRTRKWYATENMPWHLHSSSHSSNLGRDNTVDGTHSLRCYTLPT